MTWVYAWLDVLSTHLGEMLKGSRPFAPTKVYHPPTRVLRDASTATPTTAHQSPARTLVDLRGLWNTYNLVFAWALATLGLVAVFLARFVNTARSEEGKMEGVIDLYTEIDHDSTNSGSCPDFSTSLYEPIPTPIRSEGSIGLSDLVDSYLDRPLYSGATGSLGSIPQGVDLVGLEHLVDVYAESNSSIEVADLEIESGPVDHPEGAVRAPILAHFQGNGSFSSIIELYGDSNTSSPVIHLDSSTGEDTSSSAGHSDTAFATRHPSSSGRSRDGGYSPKHKRQLKALITDVLARQRRGQTLQIGDLRLEDYEDSDYSPPQEDRSTLENGVSPSPGQEDSIPIPLRRRFELPAWTPIIGVRDSGAVCISTVDPTMVPLPAEDDELSSTLPTSDSLDVICGVDYTSDDSTLGRVTRDEAFAELCNEIGASFSSFNLSRRLGSAGNSTTSNFLQNSTPFESGEEGSINAEDGLSRSSLRDIGSPATTVTSSRLLRPTISSIIPSLFVSSSFEFDRTYNNLMRLHRRRLELYFSLSVHLVQPLQPRRLMSHRMHSCAIYRTEAIGMLGQILSESLKDATRVVGNCHPEARNNGGKFEVSIRIVSRATRHHWDSDLGEWVSLGWDSCECAFQLVVDLDNSPLPPNPNNENASSINLSSFWTRLWMYQLWDGQGDTFGPPQSRSSDRSMSIDDAPYTRTGYQPR
ncbi:hypothetical protein FRC11_000966, partial [Ceratobasidium sp. 423]